MPRMKIRTLVFTALAALIYSGSTVTPVVAAQTGQSNGGFSFTCDTILNKCTCEGSTKGADCKAMAKNCKGATLQSDGKYKNYILECASSGGVCRKWTCEMSRKSNTGIRFPPKITPLRPGKVIAPPKDKPKTGTIMKMVPMKRYKMAPTKKKSN